MNRVFLPLLVMCGGLLQHPVHSQEPDPDAALQSLNAKLDLILKRIDSIDRRLDTLKRIHDDSRFSVLRTPDESRNAGSAVPAPLIFDFTFPVNKSADGYGEQIFNGINDGMRIDAIERRLRRSRIDTLNRP